MKKFFPSFLCVLLFVSALIAQPGKVAAPATAKAQSGLPPIIDRELLFGNPEIVEAQISPNGKYLAFLKPWKETRNIYVKGVDEPFSAARLLTTETRRPLFDIIWSRDSKYILYVQDNDGDENYNVYAVDPASKPAAGTEAPPSRNLTGMKDVAAKIVDIPRSDPDSIYIGLNDRDKTWHDLYKLKLSTGEKTLVRKNTEKISGWAFDLQGNLRLALRVADNGDNEILRVDPDKFVDIYNCTVDETCSPLEFTHDGKQVYIQTNKGDVNLEGLALLDPATGKATPVESDPLKRVDLGGATFSHMTDELISTSYTDDRERVYFKDKGFESDYKWLQSKLPGMELGIEARTQDEQTWVVLAHSDVEPGITYIFNRKGHKLEKQFTFWERLPRESLAHMEPVHYQSSDGLDIPAYLTLPKGVPARNLPTVILVHGGPWGRDYWGFHGYAQLFANRGYAVLSPNFRASTGYGKKFLNAGNKQWGRLMQDDVTWGVKYLVGRGISDPKRIGIIGLSYGGYAALAGAAFTPDVYSAAVDLFGPANLITLLDSFPPYWEAGRKMFNVRIGDPSTPEGKAMLKERSPLTSADKIKTPLLIVQGANDPRVNRAESEQVVVALRDRSFPVEYLLIPDEGHGFARPVNNMASLMATEKFFAKHLGGRYQEGGTPEVVARLKEITVDPKTVVLTPKNK